MKEKAFPSLALLLSAIVHSAAISFLWQASKAPAPVQTLQVAMVKIINDRVAGGHTRITPVPIRNVSTPDKTGPSSPQEMKKEAPEEMPVPQEDSEKDNASPDYLDSTQVNVQPQLLVDVPATLAQRIPGNLSSVVLRLLINENGAVDQVLVEEESLSEEARQTLVEAFSGLEFRPALMQERPVKVQLRIGVSIGNQLVP
jgi:hypothetical protein